MTSLIIVAGRVVYNIVLFKHKAKFLDNLFTKIKNAKN